MTNRERQILAWIEADPMISQERLAELAGITRSSVAVHISNLVKKGYIAGKGYVLRSGDYVAVVGGVNIDIGGRSFDPLVAKDSNPGKVTVSLGGVGRNIAHNLSLLGTEVRFLTALGDDDHAERIERSCAELGIDIKNALRVPGGSTPTYLFLNDCDGDTALAISDMAICDLISPDYLAANLALLNNARLVVADANIPAGSLAFLAENCRSPVFADPVSTKKAVKLKPILGKLHTIKPNRIEAELLSGVPIKNDRDLEKAAKALLATGLERVVVSLGADGIFAASGGEYLRLPCRKANVVNAAGAGDAFTAALVKAQLDGADLKTACEYASAAAAICVESAETVNPFLTHSSVRARAELND